MKYKIISTGSRGNCTILEDVIAIDMGVTYSLIKRDARTLKAVLLTHKHSDHLKASTIRKLANNHPNIKFICMDYLVPELAQNVSNKNIYVLEPNKKYDLGLFKLAAFPLKHDVPNVGWRIEIKGKKCLYATDTGMIDNVRASGYNLYLVEGNYDEEEVQQRIKDKEVNGEYIYEYRAIKNHLSIQQAKEWISENMDSNGIWICMHQHNEKQKN